MEKDATVSMEGRENIKDVGSKKVEGKEFIKESFCSDLYLSAFLRTCNIPLKRVENKIDGLGKKRRCFVFEKTPEIERLRISYYNRNAKVDALTFAESVKNVKNLAYSEEF